MDEIYLCAIGHRAKIESLLSSWRILSSVVSPFEVLGKPQMYLNPQHIHIQMCSSVVSTSYTHIYVDTSESPLNLTYERPKEKVLMLMGRREVGSLSLQTDLCQIQEKLTKESEMLFEVMLGTHKMTKFCLHFYNRGQYMNLFSACCLTSATFLAWSCTPSNVCIFYLPVD